MARTGLRSRSTTSASPAPAQRGVPSILVQRLGPRLGQPLGDLVHRQRIPVHRWPGRTPGRRPAPAPQFADFDYQASMRRYGCDTCANYIVFRGTPDPLTANNNWYHEYKLQYCPRWTVLGLEADRRRVGHSSRGLDRHIGDRPGGCLEHAAGGGRRHEPDLLSSTMSASGRASTRPELRAHRGGHVPAPTQAPAMSSRWTGRGPACCRRRAPRPRRSRRQTRGCRSTGRGPALTRM